jgi:hypothetical protein
MLFGTLGLKICLAIISWIFIFPLITFWFQKRFDINFLDGIWAEFGDEFFLDGVAADGEFLAPAGVYGAEFENFVLEIVGNWADFVLDVGGFGEHFYEDGFDGLANLDGFKAFS